VGKDPRLGRDRPELGVGVRSKIVLEYPYLIFFRPTPRGDADVIRVLHQARELEAAFREANPGS
jgi:plasmid stabilization system protein ParE